MHATRCYGGKKQHAVHVLLMFTRYEMLPHLFAYLDLASGSMIIQAAIAGVVAVPILFRNQIRRLLGRGRPSDTSLTDEPTTTPGTSPDPLIEHRAEGSDPGRP
jgi:hypothetical protein